MLYMIAYFFAAYILVGILLLIAGLCFHAILTRQGNDPIRRGNLFGALVIGLIMLPFLPYAVVGAQTRLYGRKFVPVVRKALANGGGNPGDPIYILRVLKLTPWDADIYIVQPMVCVGETQTGERAGCVLHFRRVSQRWQYQDFDCVWADCASAHGNTFPPYPEARVF